MVRRRNGLDRILDACVWLAPVIVSSLFLWLLLDVAARGLFPFLSPSGGEDGVLHVPARITRFLMDAPGSAGRSGGIGPILVSTGLILIVCLAVSLPFGLGTALFLSEFVADESRCGKLIRRSMDVLAGVPSIVFGLFGNALFCRLLGLRYSILAGGLTLACMVLPLLIRSVEEGLRAVPNAQRQAAAALGFSRWSTVFRIVLPQASPGIAVGLILGIGRALAETAALMFTSGYVDRMPRSLFDSGRSLAIHVYDLSMNVPGGNPRAYASALTLIIALVIINAVAQVLTGRMLHTEGMRD